MILKKKISGFCSFGRNTICEFQEKQWVVGTKRNISVNNLN